MPALDVFTSQQNQAPSQSFEKRILTSLGQFHIPHAHTVSVDPKSHLVYFPLENVNGHPLLRIMTPDDR